MFIVPGALEAHAEEEVSHSSIAVRKENVRPGDVDYPVSNPRAMHKVRLLGAMPATLRVHFLLSYAVDSASEGPSRPPDHCSFVDQSGQLRPLSVQEPLIATRASNRYTALLFLDRKLPGPCGWHLAAVGFTVTNGVGVLAEQWFGQVYDAHFDAPHLGDEYEGSLDEWCKRNPFPPDPNRPEECSDLSTIRRLLSAPTNLTGTPNGNVQPEPQTVWIFSSTRSIEVNFHDLDALNTTGADR